MGQIVTKKKLMLGLMKVPNWIVYSLLDKKRTDTNLQRTTALIATYMKLLKSQRELVIVTAGLLTGQG